MRPSAKDFYKILKNNIDNVEPAVKKGINEYSQDLVNEVVRKEKEAAPFWEGGVKKSIRARSARSTRRNGRLIVDATAPHAGYTEVWPTPHLVPVNKYPRVRRWVEDKGLTDMLLSNKYLRVYSGNMRVSNPSWEQHWFRETAREVLQRYGVSRLVKKVESSLVKSLGRGWFGDHAGHVRAGELGALRRMTHR